MTQPASGYPPYQPLPPTMGIAAPPKRSRGGLTSMLAGILALAAAGLVIGGSFAPITSYQNSYEGDGDTTVYGNNFGWWGYTDNGSTTPIEEETSLIGLALVLVAALLVLGAVFAFVASATRSTAPTTGGRSLIAAGVGVLAGAVLLQGLSVIEQASLFNDRELEAGESLDYTPGLGLILPLAGLALGLIAVVLAHVGQRPQAFRVEPSTPRMGFPAPYGRRPAAPAPVAAERPTDVDVNNPAKQEEPDDDADDTQVISSATASGTGSVSAALAGETPATDPTSTPATAEGATPVAPTPAPSTSDSTPATAESAAPAAPDTATPTPEPAQPAAPPVDQTDPTPEEPSTPAEEGAEPSAPEPTPLTDLPAAPAPPELKKDQ